MLTAGRWLNHRKKHSQAWTSARQSFAVFLLTVQGNNRSVSKSLANCFLIISLQNIVVGLMVKAIYLVQLITFIIWHIRTRSAVANFSPARNVKVTLGHKHQVSYYNHFFLNHHLFTEEHLVITNCYGHFYFIFSSRSFCSEVCLSQIQFNISYLRIHGSHYYPAHPWLNTPVIVIDNKTQKGRH